ncbi:unnamed protein product [Rhodiola kirilowii]
MTLDRMLMDASAGGTIMNLSPTGVRNLIAEVAKNARFREEASRHEEFSRTRNVMVQVKPCEFCGATNHKTDAYPSLQEDTQANVNAVGEFQNYNNHAPQQTQQQQYYRPPYRQQQGGYNNQNQYQ